MLSFDVVSLFTAIPVDKACDYIHKKLLKDETLSSRTSLDSNEIISLLNFVLSNNYFVYDDKIYKQIHGCAMGNPVSPVVANLCMEAIEEVAINSSEVQPKVWKRFVDDSFCIIKRNAVNSFHTTLNSIDPHISFTIVEESDQQIAFLDTLVSRKNNTITIDVFAKQPTRTDIWIIFLIITKAIRSAQLRPSYIAQPNSLIQHKGKIPKSTTSLMPYELTTIPLILFLTSSRRNFPNHPHMPSLHQKNLFACFLNGLHL